MIEIQHVTKHYGKITALTDVTCTIHNGEFVSFLGPSGSGKSTLLNIVAGILPLSSGAILFDGIDGNTLDSKSRNIGFVFQNYALYPNLSVQKNLLFPLESLKVQKADRNKMIGEVAEMVRIEHLLAKKPNELSGGEQQRVAIARALVKKPKLLLLDEPFSNLDPHLSTQMRSEIKKLQLQLKITTIMVTHNQSEAMELSDRIALLSNGELMQIGSVSSLYKNPNNLFSAMFLGDVRINAFHGTISNRIFNIDGTSQSIPVQTEIKQRAVLCIRPENLSIAKQDKNQHICLPVIVTAIFNHGREIIVNASLGENDVRFIIPASEANVQMNQIIDICFDPSDSVFFDEASEKRIDVII